MTWIEGLDKLDKILFLFIHHDSDHQLLDNVFLLIRNPLTWLPLYGFMLYYALTRFNRDVLLFIALSLATILLCDRISAGWLKPLFERPRPCFDPVIQPLIRNLLECGGIYSFPSSHAANHFGLASFWYWSVFNATGKKWNWLWVWAIVIGYAQVYVGKHYPLDIVAGLLLGLIVGTTMAKILEYWPSIKKLFVKASFHNKPLET